MKYLCTLLHLDAIHAKMILSLSLINSLFVLIVRWSYVVYEVVKTITSIYPNPVLLDAAAAAVRSNIPYILF